MGEALEANSNQKFTVIIHKVFIYWLMKRKQFRVDLTQILHLIKAICYCCMLLFKGIWLHQFFPKNSTSSKLQKSAVINGLMHMHEHIMHV